MHWVIRIAELPEGIPEVSNLVGRYVVTATVNDPPGQLNVQTHEDPLEAYKFRTYDAAHAYWRQQSISQPFNEHGQPNQPLMMIDVHIEARRESLH